MARWTATLLLAFLAVPTQVLQAGIVCPESTTVSVTFDCTFTGLYQPGQPFDILTIVPSPPGVPVETFASAGIHISVRVRDCDGQPVVGLPASSIVLSAPTLCICPGGNIADGPTDAEGRTTFSGRIRGGGYAESLTLFVDGTAVVTNIPVRINSPDSVPQSPCSVDAGDHSVPLRVGIPSQYTICADLNEDGVIDLIDLIIYSAWLGAHCP